MPILPSPFPNPDIALGSYQVIWRRGKRIVCWVPFPSGIVGRNRPKKRSRDKRPFVFSNRPKAITNYWPQHSKTWESSGFTQDIISYNTYDSRIHVSRANPKDPKTGYWIDGGDFAMRRITREGTRDMPEVRVYQRPDQGGQLVARLNLQANPLGKFSSIPEPAIIDHNTLLANLALQYEASGRARTDPLRPQVSLGQTVLETARDPLRGVGWAVRNWRRSPTVRGALKASGSEWLNLQFSLLPTVSDVMNGISLILEIDAVMAKWRREVGRPITRRATLKDTTEVIELLDFSAYPFWGCDGAWTGLYNNGGTHCVGMRIQREKVQYKAKYKYALTPGPVGSLDILTRKFGVRPDFSLAWQLTGWSWLIDWFTNIRSIIRNIDSNISGQTVLLYSYLTKEVSMEDYWTLSVNADAVNDPNISNFQPQQYRHTARMKITDVTKLRVGSRNPYGFYASLPDLTVWQTSILAALGVSRGRVKARA